jgi:hypothetical protein
VLKITTRSLRSRKALEEAEEAPELEIDLQNVQSSRVGTEIPSGEKPNENSMKGENSVVSGREQQELRKNRETDFLSRIVKLMEEEREERGRLRREDKKEFQDALEQFSLKLAKIVDAKIDNLSKKLTERLETEIIKLSDEVASLKEETEEKLQVVSSKFNSLKSSVHESLNVQMSTFKQNNEVLSQTLVDHKSNTADSMGEIRQEISTLKEEKLSNKLNNHKKEVESKFENIQAEIVNLRHGVIVDKYCELEKKLERKFKEPVDGRLGEIRIPVR